MATTTTEVSGILTGERTGITGGDPNITPTEFSMSDVQVSSDGTITATVTGNDGSTSIFTGTLNDGYGNRITPPAGATWAVTESELSEASTGNVLQISASEYAIPAENTLIVDDASLVAELVRSFGEPVRSINGITPDSSGNIEISGDGNSVSTSNGSYDPDTGECTCDENVFRLVVTGTNANAGVITIALNKPITCDTNTVVQMLMENINELNKRLTQLGLSITALDTANNNLAARLTGLG